MLSVGSVVGVVASAALGMGAGLVALVLSTSHAEPGAAGGGGNLLGPMLATPAATPVASKAPPSPAVQQAATGASGTAGQTGEGND
jgi:hypothetical protein